MDNSDVAPLIKTFHCLLHSFRKSAKTVFGEKSPRYFYGFMKELSKEMEELFEINEDIEKSIRAFEEFFSSSGIMKVKVENMDEREYRLKISTCKFAPHCPSHSSPEISKDDICFIGYFFGALLHKMTGLYPVMAPKSVSDDGMELDFRLVRVIKI